MDHRERPAASDSNFGDDSGGTGSYRQVSPRPRGAMAEGDITAEGVASRRRWRSSVVEVGMRQPLIEQRPPGTPRRPPVLSPLAPASR